MIPDKLSDKWLKAAVIGGLWASIEIVIGSFLHNLRIPFAGTILASQGILILIAFNQVWKESGIIIRAGIITALMKSISPSSVILGPMIGIVMEAALLEVFLLVFRRGVFGAVIASAIALSSALLHKVFSIIILYGWNIVIIYKNMYVYLQKVFNTELLAPMEFIFLVLFVYLFFGAITGILGIYIGKKVSALIPGAHLLDSDFSNNELFPLSGNQKFNIFLLGLNILCIPIGLILINKNIFEFGLPFMLVFIVYMHWRYIAIFRRLKKPVFWLQIVIIIILSGLFYSAEGESNAFFNPDGIYLGLEMSLRALFIVVVFTAISIELRNPLLKKFIYAHHLGSLYSALSLAFNSLPIIIKSLPPVKEFFSKPVTTLSLLIATNIQWYTIFKKQILNEFDK